MGTIRIILLATIFGCSAITHTWCLDFNFSTFEDNDQFTKLIVSKESRVFGNTIQVTLDLRGFPITNKSGRVVYNQKFKLRNKDKEMASFNTTFVLNISPHTSTTGREGLAFILAADPSPPANSYGEWLGIVNSSTHGTPQAQIVAIEFDTRKSFPEDIDSNHVGLNVNSIFSIAQKPLLKFGVGLSLGSDIFGMIRYDGENISIYVSMSSKIEDQLKNLIIFQPLDLSVLPDEVYVGFSGSTSNYTQLNCVSKIMAILQYKFS